VNKHLPRKSLNHKLPNHRKASQSRKRQLPPLKMPLNKKVSQSKRLRLPKKNNPPNLLQRKKLPNKNKAKSLKNSHLSNQVKVFFRYYKNMSYSSS
jgi:hypothetical protein